MAKIKTTYVCSNCGSVSAKWLGKCPDCNEWNTFTEQLVQKSSSKAKLNVSPTTSVVELSQVEGLETTRFSTGINELDNVLGGGIVKGSVVLIGGEPGIGKSTVMLQVAGILTKREQHVLYVSGEESPGQIKLRADRLKLDTKGMTLLASTSLDDVIHASSNGEYAYIVIDSIQTIVSDEIEASSGTVSQVRHVTYRLVELAKSKGIAIFIVGQVTKDGNIAGPKVLEHLVDTVLYFEGDYSRGVRILRSVKNRFGSTDEIGIFEMSSVGLVEAGNKAFIDTDAPEAAGKVLTAVLEGARPFLVEIQALVTPTFFQFPKRNATGFDNNRLTMLIAILEKKGGLNLSGADVYLNVAGGLKVFEPAADLAVCAALISSLKDIAVPYNVAFAGEIGLTGEVRAVPAVTSRAIEASRFSVKTFYVPSKNEKSDVLKLVNIDSIETLVKRMIK